MAQGKLAQANNAKPSKIPANFANKEQKLPKELAEKYTKNIENLKKSVEQTEVILSENNKPSAKAGRKQPTVAIFSERNVSWIGVGQISKGYNIVTQEAAKQWLTRNHVREATPEEVAAEFGV